MKEIKELEQKINWYNDNYEKLAGTSENLQHDIRISKLKKLDPNNKFLSTIGKSKNLSTKREKFKHIHPMLSLDKSLEFPTLQNWLNKNKKFGEEFLFQVKMDGLALSLHYEKGKLIRGVTRGDGIEGDIIGDNVFNIQGVPHEIENSFNGEVRGEVVITKSDFKLLQEQEETKELLIGSNARNLAAGSLKLKNPDEVLKRKLTFFGYDIIGKDDSLKLEIEKNNWLKKVGFVIPLTFVKNINDIEKEWNRLKQERDSLNYEIDGVVIKFNLIETHELVGYTEHHPRWAIAQKFEAVGGVGKILGVEWQLGRTGVMTPVIKTEPINISGVNIQRVTAHNLAYLREKNLKLGSLIEVVRSGDVIPKIVGIIEDGNKELNIPENCPHCGKTLKFDGIRLLCDNKKCYEREKIQIEYFVGKLNIEGLGNKLINILFKSGIIKTTSDLFKIKKEDLLKLDRVGSRLADKILFGINERREVELNVFLTSLGIDGLGDSISKDLVTTFSDLNIIRNLKKEDLNKLEGIEDITSTKIIEGLKENSDIIDELLKYISFKKITNNKIETLKGKSFCMTGTLSKGRKEIEKEIINNGGKISSSVSSNLSYLVTNDPSSNSSKAKKSRELGIDIISEKELYDLF